MAFGIDYTPGTPHTNGAPTHDPGSEGSKIAYDYVNRVKYKHVSGPTWEVDASGGGTFSDGSVIFSNGAALSEDNQNLFWSRVKKWFSINKTTHQNLATVTIQGAADTSNIGGTGTVSGNTLTGTGTSFLTELAVGDRISLANAPSSYVVVSSIASNTSLDFVGSGLSGSSQQINRKKSILRIDRADGNPALIVGDDGSAAIGGGNPDVNYNLTTGSALFGSDILVSGGIKCGNVSDAVGGVALRMSPRALIEGDGATVALDFATPSIVSVFGELQVSNHTSGPGLAIRTDDGVAKEIGVEVVSGSAYDTVAFKSSIPNLRFECASKFFGPFVPPVMDSGTRDSLTPDVGWQIFCTDATADDSSTGVTQTYNGSTWKNHW